MACSIRIERIKKARLIGSHTRLEWENLKEEFDYRCVRCGFRFLALERDHIIPIYQGGGDSIDNIQPLCGYCNSQKGAETINWKDFRNQMGWIFVQIKLSPKHPYLGKIQWQMQD